MSTPQFTPAPWEARPCYVNEDTTLRKKGEATGEFDIVHDDGHASIDGDPWFVATVCDGAPGSTEANARLIAAAPELYEALTKARTIIQAERDSMVECATMPPEHDIATLDAMTKPYVEEFDAALAEIDVALAKVQLA